MARGHTVPSSLSLGVRYRTLGHCVIQRSEGKGHPTDDLTPLTLSRSNKHSMEFQFSDTYSWHRYLQRRILSTDREWNILPESVFPLLKLRTIVLLNLPVWRELGTNFSQLQVNDCKYYE